MVSVSGTVITVICCWREFISRRADRYPVQINKDNGLENKKPDGLWADGQAVVRPPHYPRAPVS